MQSYDEVSIPARGFRPGIAPFPTCRAAWLLPRVCVRSHASRGGRGTPVFRGPLEGGQSPFCFLTGEILLPSWAAIFFQLGSSAALSDALSVHSVPRPLEPNWGV